MSVPNESLQLRTLITENAILELSLASAPLAEPGPDEVVVRIEASPINPSDLGLLFGMADITKAEAAGTAEAPVVTAPVSNAVMRMMKARVGKSLGAVWQPMCQTAPAADLPQPECAVEAGTTRRYRPCRPRPAWAGRSGPTAR